MNKNVPDLDASYKALLSQIERMNDNLVSGLKSLAAQISELQEEGRQSRIDVEQARSRVARKARLWAIARPAIMALIISVLTILALHYWR